MKTADPTMATEAQLEKNRKSRARKNFILKSLLPHVGLASVGVLFLLPFAWLVATALKDPNEIFSWPPSFFPKKLYLLNYKEAIDTIPFLRYLFNTVVIALMTVIGQVLASPLVAYSIAKIKWRGRNVVFFIIMATMMIPFPVTMVPTYVLFNKMGMIDTYYPLILPNFFGTAFYIFLLRQFFLTIPDELSDAARIDGASEFRIYWQVVLPLARPAIYTVALFSFLGAWTDFLGPLIYLNNPDLWTLSIGLQSYIGENKVAWGPLMAAASLFTFPIIILYFFVQRQFIQGITMTGFK